MIGRLKWLAVVLLVGGLVFAWMGWQASETWARLEQHGKTTGGVIEGLEVTKSRRSGKSYKMVVSYTPAGGAPMRETFAVTKACVDKRVRGDTIVDDKCTVRYDPADPRTALIEGGWKDDRWMLNAGIGGFALGALGTFLLFRRKAPPAAPAA